MTEIVAGVGKEEERRKEHEEKHFECVVFFFAVVIIIVLRLSIISEGSKSENLGKKELSWKSCRGL